MDFSLSPEQTAIRDAVRQYCRDSYGFRSRMGLLHSPDGFGRDHWETFAELGWLGAAFPEDAGGFGGSAIENAVILEEFGRALVLEPFLACAVLAGQAINASGQPARTKYLPAMMSGKTILAFAHPEPRASGHVEHVETSAQPSDRGYKLCGVKSMVLAGPAADKFIVSARLSGNTRDRDGVGLFVVDRDARGLLRKDYRLLDGSRASDLTLEDVAVCPDCVVGSPGGGVAACEWALGNAIVGICAEAVGIMDSVVWITRDFLKGRDQSGVPLNTCQALQHRMADMLVEIEMSRSVLYRGLHALAQEDSRARRKGISACKVQVTQSAKFVGTNGVQLHGAMGLTDDHRMGQYFKRLTVIGMLFGDTDFHLEQFGTT